MHKLMVSLATTACLVALFGAFAPTQAALVTFVSGDGGDGNSCQSPAAACREIGGPSGALSKTDSGGTIYVLPGKYAEFRIRKSVSIIAEGGLASIEGSVPNDPLDAAISIINIAPEPTVVRLRGLAIDAAGTAILMSGSSATVHVEHCVIVSHSYGINFFPGTVAPANLSQLYVSDSMITRPVSGSFPTGILVRPRNFSIAVNVVVDNVRVEDNGTGIDIDARGVDSNYSVKQTVAIRNSTVAGNTRNGILAIGGSKGAINVMIEGSTFANNGRNGVGSSGSATTVRMRNSTATGNVRGILAGAGGKLISHGGDVVAGNATNGVFTSTAGQQ